MKIHETQKSHLILMNPEEIREGKLKKQKAHIVKHKKIHPFCQVLAGF